MPADAPVASLRVYSAEVDGAVGTIAVPVRDQLNAATAMSFWQADLSSWLAPGARVARHIIQGNILPMQRNEAVQRMEGDWLVFVDDDMVFDSDAIKRLVFSWSDLGDPMAILGGLCFRRMPPHQPTMYMREHPDSGAYNFLESWSADIVEVDATGCAFLLIPKGVFEAIAETPLPPLGIRRLMPRPPEFFVWSNGIGEDLRFCQDAKRAGARIFVDTTIEIGHMTESMVDVRSYWASIAERTTELEGVRREINDRMGLPTLTSAEARSRLGWT